jgi:hypothetical protein
MSTVLAAFLASCCIAQADEPQLDVELTPVASTANVDIGSIHELRRVHTHVDDEPVDGIVVVGSSGAAVLRESDLSLVSEVHFAHPHRQPPRHGHSAILDANREIMGFVKSVFPGFTQGVEVYDADGVLLWQEDQGRVFHWVVVTDADGDGDEDIIYQAAYTPMVRAATIDKKQIYLQRWGERRGAERFARIDLDHDGVLETAYVDDGVLYFRSGSGEIVRTVELPVRLTWVPLLSASYSLTEPPTRSLLIFGHSGKPIEWRWFVYDFDGDRGVREVERAPQRLGTVVCRGKDLWYGFSLSDVPPELLVRSTDGHESRIPLAGTGATTPGGMLSFDESQCEILLGVGHGLWRCKVTPPADAAD